MNPADRPIHSDPSPMLYDFPCAHWTLPQDGMTPLIARMYEDAYAVLTEPDGEIAAHWADALEEGGYRAITQNLTLPQIVSLVSELPPSAVVRLTGRRPTDGARREVVRSLYAPAED